MRYFGLRKQTGRTGFLPVLLRLGRWTPGDASAAPRSARGPEAVRAVSLECGSTQQGVRLLPQGLRGFAGPCATMAGSQQRWWCRLYRLVAVRRARLGR